MAMLVTARPCEKLRVDVEGEPGAAAGQRRRPTAGRHGCRGDADHGGVVAGGGDAVVGVSGGAGACERDLDRGAGAQRRARAAHRDAHAGGGVGNLIRVEPHVAALVGERAAELAENDPSRSTTRWPPPRLYTETLLLVSTRTATRLGTVDPTLATLRLDDAPTHDMYGGYACTQPSAGGVTSVTLSRATSPSTRPRPASDSFTDVSAGTGPGVVVPTRPELGRVSRMRTGAGSRRSGRGRRQRVGGGEDVGCVLDAPAAVVRPRELGVVANQVDEVASAVGRPEHRLAR